MPSARSDTPASTFDLDPTSLLRGERPAQLPSIQLIERTLSPGGEPLSSTFVRPFGSAVYLHPGEFAIARTLEHVRLPNGLSGEAIGRSSLGRLGLVIATATLIQPGFRGTITLELTNLAGVPIVLYVGIESRSYASTGSNSVNSRHRYAGQYAPESSRLYEDRDLFWIVPFRVQYIVGVVGRRFAGKSSALTYLHEKRGFRVYSMAAIVRDNALSIGLPLEPRSHLQDLGDDLRAGVE